MRRPVALGLWAAVCVRGLVAPPTRPPRAGRCRPLARSSVNNVEESRARRGARPRDGRRRLLEAVGVERDKFVRGLSVLDRGEFRWEFLTPWVDRELTRADKVIVCSAFIGVAIVGQKLLEPDTAVSQHLSYVANFFSYTIGNQIGYRIIAIVASLLEIFAYGVEDGGFGVREDAIPESYNVLFIVVNLYYVLRWTLNRSDTLGAALLSDVEAELFERCFEPLGVKPYQFLKLLGNAEWVDPTERRALTVEGEPVKSLFVSIAGDFDVVSGGTRVASIPPFQVIGEVALLENLQSADGSFHQASRATVLADPGSSYISWSHETLYDLKNSDEEFARAMQLAIARTLSHKLGSARATTGALLREAATADDDATDGGAADLQGDADVVPGDDDDDRRVAGTVVDARRRSAVAVRSVLSPADERIYTSCFLRRGFEDQEAFAALIKVGEETAVPQNSDDAADRVVARERDRPRFMFVLTSGAAEGFVDGVKVQSFAPLALIGAAPMLENVLLRSADDLAESAARSPETVVLAPGSQFLSFAEADLKRACAASPQLREALRDLYVAETARAVPDVLASQDVVPLPRGSQ